MSSSIHVLGGAQTDFALKWGDRPDPLLAMLSEAIDGALDDAAIDPGTVETAHVGNFLSERFTGQAHLGGLVPMIHTEWGSLPTARHEGACASGSLAMLAASAELEAGRYDVALVVGCELMRNVPGPEAAAHLGAAAWAGHETTPDVLPWPDLFDRIAGEVEARTGLDLAHLDAIAELNRTNARRNSRAQTRGWSTSGGTFARNDDSANPQVAGRLRASDCGRITDGAAAVVLASQRFAEGWRRRTGRRSSVVRGWGHRTAPLPLAAKLEASTDGYLFPHARSAILSAYQRAGIAGVGELDVIELHDCFTITELVALEHLGIAPPGKAGTAIEAGTIAFDGDLPVNPSGGLIGAGHPVGASGVRMALDVHRQVTGSAGDYQVEAARTGATLNIGGSFGTVVSFVIGQE